MALRFLILFAILGESLSIHAQWTGCTDPLALNYDPGAVFNDGSCAYAAEIIAPEQSLELQATLAETSGLIEWDGSLWTHNDDTDTHLYALDPQDASLIQECLLSGAMNLDWEDVDQDGQWIYIGDFGNNASGNRQDLHILRVKKSTICNSQPTMDTIWFDYEDQTDFGNQGSNNTDFDCEAMVVGQDSIYLFTKQWKSQATSVYGLPKVPGNHTARLRAIWPMNGLVTGATWLEEERLLALSGYSALLQPFILLCYDYAPYTFFSGNKRRLDLLLPFHQIEGITTMDGLNYYLTNERLNQFVLVPPKLHRVDLSDYLVNYLGGGTPISPVPVSMTRVDWQNGGLDIIRPDAGEVTALIVDMLGRSVHQFRVSGCIFREEVPLLPGGIYRIRMGQEVRPLWIP